MNRILRTLVASASVLGALAATPAVASAQTVNVAPPAYAYRPAPVVAPVPVLPPVAVTYTTPGVRVVLPAPYGAQWHRDEARRERLRHEHERECAQAYERGAPARVLAGMRCIL